MDSTITTSNQSNNGLNIKHAEETTHQRTMRSMSHGRTSSASGIRSKIPMNINHSRPPPTITNAQMSPCTQDDSARPITPGNATRRLTRSHNSALTKSKVQGSVPGGKQKLNWLETRFKKEKKRYLTIKKELDEKQKCAQQLFDDMSQLRDKLIADGGKDPGKIEEIKLFFDQSDKQSGDQNTCHGNGESGFVINDMVNQEFILIMENTLKHYLKDHLILCEDVLKQHSEMWKLIENFDKNDEKLGKEMSQHVNNIMKDTEELNKRLESGKKLADEFNITVKKNVMMMWAEIETSRLRIKHLESVNDDTVNELRFKLNTEMEKMSQLKEKKTMVDNELMKSKARVQALETRINADEAKMVQLQSQMKNMENQLKQKDVNFEHGTRDLHKSLKHSEETIVCLETEKNNLESRLNEIEDNLEKEKKRCVEKSPRIQAERLTEDESEHDKDLKKKVEELEKLIETLRGEVVADKEFIVRLQNEKSSSEMQLKEQLTNEQTLSIKLRESYEQLKRKHESLQQKIESRESQMVTSHHDHYDYKNIKKTSDTSEFIQLIEALRQEISDLKRKNKDLETQSQLQLKNLGIKNQMITYLKGAHSDDTNSDVHQVDKEIDSKADVLRELYSALETKQMQLTHLENVLKQMEGQEMRNQEQRTRYEKRIAQLEFDAQMRKNKDCRYVKNIPILHSSKQNEVAKALELERKYQKLKRESWQMENIYNKLRESTVRSAESRDSIRNLRRPCRDEEHACRSLAQPRRVNVGCYVHQIVDQCGRELNGSSNSTSSQKVGCRNRLPHRMMERNLSSKREVCGHIRQ